MAPGCETERMPTDAGAKLVEGGVRRADAGAKRTDVGAELADAGAKLAEAQGKRAADVAVFDVRGGCRRAAQFAGQSQCRILLFQIRLM
ncbi:hypothetical protein [Rathayibacter soli]|uniref:hypothetical protein n=1 Tax=Rathayibacter soli TaxID=3144168 RepID=UPI0027E49688|nr:hypothetical protein [Glaciibacter superstes]